MFKTVFVNTGSNLFVMIVKLVITFIMAPLFVHNLGNYDYGIWEIIVAVIGYMGLLDMGFKPAISRFVAAYSASRKTDRLQELYSTSFYFLAIIGVILFIFFISWAFLRSQYISESGRYAFKYFLLLIIIGAQLLIEFPGYVAESFLEGFQKYYLKNNITLINSIISFIVLYNFIAPDNALILLASANAIGLSVKYILYTFILTRPAFGGLRPVFSKVSLRAFKETAGFGVKSLIQGIASRIEIGTDTIVIGYFLGPAIVPFYVIPANIVSHIRNIGWTLTHAFMPLFSELYAKGKAQEIQSLYLSASRYVVAFLLPISVGVTIIGSDFIGVWMGEQYTKNADAIILLLVIYMAMPFLNPFSTRYLTGIGKNSVLAIIYPISACVNLIASILLVQYMGIIGVAIGSVIPVFILAPVLLKSCCRFLGISVMHYIAYSIWPTVIPTASMWLSVYLFKQYHPLNSYSAIILSVITGAVVYAVLFYLLSMKSHERLWLKSRCRQILQAINRGALK